MTDCVIICYFSTPNIAPLRQNTAKIRGQVYIIYRTFIYQKSTFLIVFNYLLDILVLFVIIGLLLRKYTGSYQTMSGIDASEIIKSFELTGLVPKLIYIIPILLILMFLTFIAYSLLAGILASMTTNTEDFQQLQTPIMLISLAGYYLALMTNLFKGSLFIKIVSYFPFISAILSPSLLITGDITVIDFIISCIIMVGVIFLLIRYGLRIYKVGILNYSSKDLWKKMVKALKEK